MLSKRTTTPVAVQLGGRILLVLSRERFSFMESFLGSQIGLTVQQNKDPHAGYNNGLYEYGRVRIRSNH